MGIGTRCTQAVDLPGSLVEWLSYRSVTLHAPEVSEPRSGFPVITHSTLLGVGPSHATLALKGLRVAYTPESNGSTGGSVRQSVETPDLDWCVRRAH